jgi:hypothetical protein
MDTDDPIHDSIGAFGVHVALLTIEFMNHKELFVLLLAQKGKAALFLIVCDDP